VTPPGWFGAIMAALISAAAVFLVQVYLESRRKRTRKEEVDTAAEAKLEEFKDKLYVRTDQQAKDLAAQLADCRARHTELYTQTLELRGKLATQDIKIERLEAGWAETRSDLSDAGNRYLFLEAAVDAAGFVLSPRGKLVKKTDSGEVKKYE